jgi:adenylate cyclase class 2
LPTPVETEVKLKAPDVASAERAIAGARAELLHPRHLEENLIFDEDGRFAGRGCYLRLRRTPHGGRLTWKGPKRVEGGMKVREEIEVGVTEADALQAILEAMGLRRVLRYQKYRTEYRLGELAVTLDETPVGVFLELEGPAEAIRRRVTEFGYGPDDFESASYVELFHAGGGRGDMVFPDSA